MTRTVSSAMLAALGAGATSPGYLVEIQWASFSSRLSTYGTQSWNGQTWAGGGVVVRDFAPDGLPSEIELADPDSAYRTLILGDGVRDRRVNVWLADAAALAPTDPLHIFSGYADGASIASGRVVIRLDRSSASRQFAPRDRIGPMIGCNWLAPPGTRVSWGQSTLILEAR